VRDFGIVIRRYSRTSGRRPLARGSYADEEVAILDGVLKSQYIHERLANSACDLYAASCSLARLDRMVAGGQRQRAGPSRIEAGRFFLAIASGGSGRTSRSCGTTSDEQTTRVADVYLKGNA